MNPWNSGPYQGRNRNSRYFEGWYFKQTTRDRGEAWSVIPGIARGRRRGEGYSFVQVIEGRSGRSWWFDYPLSAFAASSSRLDITVGPSRFSSEGIRLRLEGPDGRIESDMRFGPLTGLPPRLLAPGVMGPYSFMPFMECSHGLVSLDHEVNGSLDIEDRRVDFDGGRGYAEKDWGRSMPSRWIWTQSNNFEDRGNSFMFSVARIPWLGGAFDGFLCAALLRDKPAIMASWTGAKLERLALEDEEVEFSIVEGSTRVEARISRTRGGILRAPVDGLLSRRIAESMDATLDLRWLEGDSTLFEGRAVGAGLEVVGDMAEAWDGNVQEGAKRNSTPKPGGSK